MIHWRPAALLGIFATAACSSMGGGRTRTESAPDHLTGWNAVPELDAVWDRAHTTGGIIAVEPESHVVGTQAATKKTWKVADSFLKLFWGSEPIWFPSDILRRTVCSRDVKWSYFWHGASGKERDLHPWFPRGFDNLVGPDLARPLAESGAVDVIGCADVGAGASRCLYGEVTPPKSFDRWFCGGIQSSCKERLRANSAAVHPEFAGGEGVCVAGPWVQERIHGGRPEIHPADILWSRRSKRPEWRIALVPDGSDRFEKGKDFQPLFKDGPPVEGWSRVRPVELWVAFEHEAGKPAEFDVAARCLKDSGEKTVQPAPMTLPAADGVFTAMPPPIAGVTMAVRTWRKAASIRGLFVIRTESRIDGCDALVMALSGRPQGDPPASLALDPVKPRDEAFARREAGEQPALRVRAVDIVTSRRSSLRGLEDFVVETRAGFAGGTPTQADDQGVADGLNAVLRRDADARRQTFGTDKPFLIEWKIEARRADDTEVEVRVGVQPQPGDQHVTVRTFPSHLTEAILVNARPLPEAEAARKGGLERAGEILISVPPGVTVRGRGLVRFAGSQPEALRGKHAGIGFNSPAATDEWAVIEETLQSIAPAKASNRLRKLQALACEPLAPSCSVAALAKHAQQQIRNPATRFDALRTFEAPQRSFARYVRYLAVAYLFNGSADSAEAVSLKTLLEDACAPRTAPAPPAGSFCQ